MQSLGLRKYISLHKFSTLLLRKAHGTYGVSSDNTQLVKQLFVGRPSAKLLILLFGLLSAVFGIVSPYFQREFIDNLTQVSSLTDLAFEHACTLMVFAFLASLASQGFNAICRTACMRESTLANRWLSGLLYQHSLQLESTSRSSKTVGETVSLYAQDVSSVCMILDDVLPNIVASFFPLVASPLAIWLLFDIPVWPAVLVSLMSLGACLALSYRQSGLFAKVKSSTEARLSVVNEWLQNIRAIRVLGWTAHFEKLIFQRRQTETVNRIQMVSNGGALNSIAQVAPLLMNVAGVTTLLHYSTNPITPGQIFGLLWILGVFLNRPIRMLPWTLVMGLDAYTSASRLERYLSLNQEIQPDKKPRQGPLEVPQFGLHVKHLSLELNGRTILDDVSFDVHPGEFVAIIGEVGAGKTLLLHSLLREVPARFSSYHIGHIDALTLNLEQLRSLFAYVPQESFVMSASLRDNIYFEYEMAAPKDDSVIASLNVAQFQFKNENIEFGTNTEIGERGVNLSGGQRQRVSLARAHLHNRPIVLLDDCLSALDVETEHKINEKLLKGDWGRKTRLLITHRLSILPHCDRILFLEDGKLVEHGRYTDLLARSSRMKKFVASVEQNAATPVEARP